MITQESSSEVMVREARASAAAASARTAEGMAKEATSNATLCLAQGEALLAEAWINVARAAADVANGHVLEAHAAFPGSREERAAREAASRAEGYVLKATGVGRRD